MKGIFVLLLISGFVFGGQRTVLVEVFASTTCQYCTDAVRGVEELKNYHGDTVSILVYYPGATDPFRVTESYQRATYYSISGVPVAIFDGVKRVEGGSPDRTSMYPVYRDTFDVRKIVDQPVVFEVTGNYDPDSRHGDLQVTILNLSGDTLSGYLRTVEVLMDTNYQWQDMDHLFYVVRKMFPDAKGIFVKILPYDVASLNIEFAVGGLDTEEKVAFVLFLQNDETKEVLGSRPEVRLTSLSWSSVSEVSRNGIKVISGRKSVKFLLGNSSVVSDLSIFDVHGREIFEKRSVTGEISVNLKPGIYFYRSAGIKGKFVVY